MHAVVRLAFAGLVLFGAAVRCAHAAPILIYEFDMSEDLNVLENPGNAAIMHNASWKTPAQMMVERAMPFFRLENNSQSTTNITQFSMTIGYTPDNFDWVKQLTHSPGVGITLVTPNTGMNDGIVSDVLTLKFTNFGPGKFVEFQAGLTKDVPGGMPWVDYRHTFFNNPADVNFGDSSHNSKVTLTATGLPPTTQLLPNQVLPMGTATGIAFRTRYMDMVSLFEFPGQITPVPEPSSFALCGAGLALLAGVVWRRRRAA